MLVFTDVLSLTVESVSTPQLIKFPLAEVNIRFACETGHDEGGYLTYWGLDDGGQVAQLVVDFLVPTTDEEYGPFRHLYRTP